MSLSSTQGPDKTSRRRRPAEHTQDPPWEPKPQAGGPNHEELHDRLCGGEQLNSAGTPSSHQSICPTLCPRKCISTHTCPNHYAFDDNLVEIQSKRTIRAENEVEANKLVNNYRFGFRKWKSHVTERPFEDRSEVVKELYSDLNTIKPHSGRLITCGNVVYVFLFGWWVSLAHFLVGLLMFITVTGIPYGKLCWKLSLYFLWPFGKSVHEIGNTLRRCCEQAPDCECNIEEDTSPVLLPSPTEVPLPELPGRPLCTPYWHRFSTYVWLLIGYPPLVVIHSLACFLAWILVFTIPVSKMNARTMAVILLLAPEDVSVSTCSQRKHQGYETRALLCCYHAVNWYYYKYTVDGINVFAVNLLPLVIIALVVGYIDRENQYASSDVKFAIAIGSIIPLSYYIGMGIASISAQSNFAVGAVVNASFGSITELTFYITALLKGHHAANPCLQEVVKAALTGTLLGCILFIPGICMIIGGLRHSEQTFNSRSTGVSSGLLFISVGGVFAPTLFSKAYGNLVCEACTNSTGGNSTSNSSGPFVCHNCHYDLHNGTLFHNHVEPLVYTVSALLPVAYIIGLIFTLKTHSHIYDIHVGEGQVTGHHGAVVHWSRWRSLVILIMATVLTSACADLVTENIQPILSQPNMSQYFIGVTVLAMVPEIPEIVNGIQFALQNNISLSLEVGICIAVQVCMLQIPVLVLFNAFYDVGFVLLFSDLHLWASIFSVILVNYIFMDGKSDYFQGTALVVVYLILLALYGGWWEGMLNGKTGMFPSNFTKEILTDSDVPSIDTPTSQEELRSSRTSKDSPGSESDGGDSRSEMGSGEIQPKKIRGFGFGDIFKDQAIKLRPRSMEMDPEGDKVTEGKAVSVTPETMKTEPDSKAKGREQCKVLFPYEAQNEDELSIKEGDIVNIITKDCADAGWWMGEIGGRQGVFPDNFVKLLEVEKERPKKPPPPSAPSAKHTTEKKSEVKKVPPERPEHLPQRDQDRGEEMKVGDIPKPSLPSLLPKKPLPPKTSSSSSSLPPRRPERPPTLACESPKSEGGASTPDSAPDRSHDADMDLDAVVSSGEKLSHPTASRPRVTDRRPRSQIITPSSLSGIDLDPPAVEDRKEKDRGKDEESVSRSVDVSLRKGVPAISAHDSKAPLPTKPSVLTPPNPGHRPSSPSSSSGLTPSPELRHSPLTPPTLEELRNQLRDLRASVELLKSQHRQEMKQLSNALDEEKRTRISLQMEVEHIKKSLSK